MVELDQAAVGRLSRMDAIQQQHMADARPRAVFVSSGIANTGVGEQGMIDASESVELAAAHVGIPIGEMTIGTTGVIGVSPGCVCDMC